METQIITLHVMENTLQTLPMFKPRLTDILENTARDYPDKPATTFKGRKQTWAEFAERAKRLGGALRGLGVGADDHVGVLALNSPQFMEAFFGPYYADAVLVPLNYRWAVPEMLHCMQDSRPSVLLVDDAHLEQGRAIGAACDFCRHLIYIGDGQTPEGFLDYETLLADAEPDVVSHRGGDDLAVLFYTGGTTGRSKGVMLSHANLCANAYGSVAAYRLPKGQVFLQSAPVFHAAAGARIYSLTLLQNHVVLMNRFDPQEALELMQSEGVNDALLVPTMVNMIFNAPGFADYDLGALRRISYGAAPMPVPLLRRVVAALPKVAFIQGYGATETSPVISILQSEAHDPNGPLADKLTSVGLPVPYCSVRIQAPDGRICDVDEVGEVCTKGPNIMLGYWNMPELTAAAIVDGWYHTGDGGYLDSDGYLFLVDRIKDMIITGGENVFSSEVENALYQHPAVKDCAVIGRPDATWGEAVHAIIVQKAGQTVNEAELIEFSKGLIARYKCPKSVSFIEVMPLSAAGKVLKTELRKAFP
ncbi:MAG: acyl-CoA synthetase (AMP-forming)/AMP-acid ligase II [Paracoccaceae bacterium]